MHSVAHNTYRTAALTLISKDLLSRNCVRLMFSSLLNFSKTNMGLLHDRCCVQHCVFEKGASSSQFPKTYLLKTKIVIDVLIIFVSVNLSYTSMYVL